MHVDISLVTRNRHRCLQLLNGRESKRMDGRQSDEQDLVDLLVAGSLTPSEFDQARTALQTASQQDSASVPADPSRKPEGFDTAGGTTTRRSLQSVPELASGALARVRPTRRQVRVGAALTALAATVIGVAYMVPVLLGEVNELSTDRIVFSDDWRLSPFAQEETNVELLAASGDDYVVSWAFVNRMRVDGERVRPAPEQQLVAVWADQPVVNTVEVDSVTLLVDGHRRFVGFPRLLGSQVVVASVPGDADIVFEVIGDGLSEIVDLRSGEQQVSAHEPSSDAADVASGDAPSSDSGDEADRAAEEDRERRRAEGRAAYDRLIEELEERARGETEPVRPPGTVEDQEATNEPPASSEPPTEQVLTDARFEGHLSSPQAAVDFGRFLTQHALEVVYLDVTVPHDGEVVTRQNSSFYIDIDPGELRCPECSYFYSVSFQGGEGPPATAHREGANVRITGYFIPDSTDAEPGEVVPNMLIGGGAVEHALNR